MGQRLATSEYFKLNLSCMKFNGQSRYICHIENGKRLIFMICIGNVFHRETRVQEHMPVQVL